MFENRAGREFLDKLSEHKDEVSQIRKIAWDDISVQDMHFLPMQQGVSTLEFSNTGIPHLLGLREIGVTTTGTLKQWETQVIFRIDNSTVAVTGSIDKEGKLILKAPLAEHSPGLYAMLNHIAVLTLHDLVIQEKRRQDADQQQAVLTNSGNSKDRRDSEDGNTKRKTKRPLPRAQREQDLINSLYEGTGYTPRRVDLHKTYVRGAKFYLEMMQEYNNASATGDATNVAIAAEYLAEARSASYQTSLSKIVSTPERFQLESVIDPVDGDTRYLQTWVIEHTSPRPTNEELSNPVKMFEKYYRRSSALASQTNASLVYRSISRNYPLNTSQNCPLTTGTDQCL